MIAQGNALGIDGPNVYPLGDLNQPARTLRLGTSRLVIFGGAARSVRCGAYGHRPRLALPLSLSQFCQSIGYTSTRFLPVDAQTRFGPIHTVTEIIRGWYGYRRWFWGLKCPVSGTFRYFILPEYPARCMCFETQFCWESGRSKDRDLNDLPCDTARLGLRNPQ